jgi:hypothetical protein
VDRTAVAWAASVIPMPYTRETEVEVGEPATARVKHHAPSGGDVSVGDERTSLPLGAESDVLEQAQETDRERAVDVSGIDVGQTGVDGRGRVG